MIGPDELHQVLVILEQHAIGATSESTAELVDENDPQGPVIVRNAVTGAPQLILPRVDFDALRAYHACASAHKRDVMHNHTTIIGIQFLSITRVVILHDPHKILTCEDLDGQPVNQPFEVNGETYRIELSQSLQYYDLVDPIERRIHLKDTYTRINVDTWALVTD